MTDQTNNTNTTELTTLAHEIERKLFELDQKLKTETQKYKNKGIKPKQNKTYDNLQNASEWCEESLTKIKRCIRNLENKKGYGTTSKPEHHKNTE